MTIQRKRCGKCFKRVGTLTPVLVTTEGQRKESWAHTKCISLWAETAHIERDPSRSPITQVALVYQRSRHKHPMPIYRLSSPATVNI